MRPTHREGKVRELLECRCDSRQAPANALSEAFAIARACKRTRTLLNELKIVLVFVVWAALGPNAFKCCTFNLNLSGHSLGGQG